VNENLAFAAWFMGGVLLFALLALILGLRHERAKKQLTHLERIKALEMGQPLPDAAVARAHAESSRAYLCGAVGIIVPLTMAAAAVGGTWLVFQQYELPLQFPLLCTIWGVCGVAALVAATSSLGVLGHAPRPERDADNPAAPRELAPSVRE
jgi:hypothetical protein